MSVATRFFQLLCNKAIPVSGHWDDIIGTLGLHPDNRHPATC
ncbi:hypothetical protein [Wolbachia endosymbiont (group A) of Cydia splendana]|nr:hypothetical protein [Wolbachia endosymbiont (group A) of Cydia splendana]